MSRNTSGASTVLTIRVTPALNRRLVQAARRNRRTRSEAARAILEAALVSGADAHDPAAEARRQSVLASARASDRDALAFVATAADLRGWR